MAENLQEKIENKVIDLITIDASGRLVVFKPEKSDKDLIVEKKADYKKKVISLNVYGGDFFGKQDLGKEILRLGVKKNFKPDENFFLMFVSFNIVKDDINEDFWIIPSVDFQKLEEKSDFSKYLINKKAFLNFLIDKLEKNK